MKWQRLRRPLRILLALFFIAAGVMHFVLPELYLQIMPPYLPYHLELVYVSGVFEILGGAGLLVRPLRAVAGYGLLALLVAVFPANVQMAVDTVGGQPGSVRSWVAVLRLPLQVPLLLWVYWCMRD
jgi:uncharacterized membrane protein